MRKQLVKTITWTEVHKGHVYLYGTQLQLVGKTLHYHNPLLASGKPLLKFDSRTNYQGERRSPDLPLLLPNRTYELSAAFETVPADRAYLQVDFYNRQNEVIWSYIQREKVGQFTCPEETFTYQILLFSAGCSDLTFDHFTLSLLEPQHNLTTYAMKTRGYLSDKIPEELSLVAPLIRSIKEEEE